MYLKIRRYREERGLTQQQLAKSIGKSFRTIQSWEREESYPNAEAIWSLCEFFDTDPNDLLGWWDDHPRDDAPPLTQEEARLVDDYRASTPERKRVLALTASDCAAMSKDAAERDQAVAEGIA